MEAVDFTRLRKLLALTASNSDGEALTAIRMANTLLERSKVHWFDVVDAMERGAAPSKPVPRRPNLHQEIDAAFDVVLCQARGKFREFILSIHAQWENTGTLSLKQRSALMKAADRARKGW